MLEQRITFSLKATLVIATLFVIHLIGIAGGSLGLITDLFITIGVIKSGKYAKNFLFDATVRQNASAKFANFLDISSVGLSLADFIREIAASTVTTEDTAVPESEKPVVNPSVV